MRPQYNYKVNFGSYVVSQDIYWYETIYGKSLHKRTNQHHYMLRGVTGNTTYLGKFCQNFWCNEFVIKWEIFFTIVRFFTVLLFYNYAQCLTLLNNAPFRVTVMWHLMPINDTKVKQLNNTSKNTQLKGMWHKWASVCAAVRVCFSNNLLCA